MQENYLPGKNKMSDELLNKIYDRVEKMSEDVVSIKVTQAVMEQDVKHHVRRSDMLEDMYTDLKEKDIDPIKADIHRFKGILQFIAYITGASGIIFGVFKFFFKI